MFTCSDLLTSVIGILFDRCSEGSDADLCHCHFGLVDALNVKMFGPANLWRLEDA